MLHTLYAGGSAALFEDPTNSGEKVGKGLCVQLAHILTSL